jgi:hypothetical protein
MRLLFALGKGMLLTALLSFLLGYDDITTFIAIAMSIALISLTHFDDKLDKLIAAIKDSK